MTWQPIETVPTVFAGAGDRRGGSEAHCEHRIRLREWRAVYRMASSEQQAHPLDAAAGAAGPANVWT